MDSAIKINSINFFVNKLNSFEEIINMNVLKTKFPLDESDNVIIKHEEKESPKEKSMFSDVIVEDIEEKA
jgi:hypothetical protein